MLPETGPPPHAHHGEEETFVLLAGEMTFHVADQTYDARPGTVLYVPPGVAHSYSNVGTGPARMLFMYSPAGVEGMFAGIGKPGRRGAIPHPWIRPTSRRWPGSLTSTASRS